MNNGTLEELKEWIKRALTEHSGNPYITANYKEREGDYCWDYGDRFNQIIEMPRYIFSSATDITWMDLKRAFGDVNKNRYPFSEINRCVRAPINLNNLSGWVDVLQRGKRVTLREDGWVYILFKESPLIEERIVEIDLPIVSFMIHYDRSSLSEKNIEIHFDKEAAESLIGLYGDNKTSLNQLRIRTKGYWSIEEESDKDTIKALYLIVQGVVPKDQVDGLYLLCDIAQSIKPLTNAIKQEFPQHF